MPTKPKVAFYWCASCGGCEEAVVDLAEDILGVVAAVDAGFSRAFLTIIDTHVTTIVSCAFLFMFGTGPVKGFAVTLVIGLIANVFTAVFVSRAIFDWELSGQRRLETLSI